jgi:hypothetical protein
MKQSDFDYFEKLKTEYLIEDESLFRFGSIGDGGYFLRPNTILKSDVLFSGGISSNLEFEYDLFRFNKDIKIMMIDPTVSGSKLIFKGIARLFFRKPDKIRYLFNSLIFNYLKSSSRCIHHKLWLNKEQSIISLITESFKTDRGVLLKMDIEGSEYDFLEEIQSNLDSFNAMVFEFHDMDEKHQLVSDFISNCSSKFQLVYLCKNPSGGYDANKRPKNIEITLERHKRER